MLFCLRGNLENTHTSLPHSPLSLFWIDFQAVCDTSLYRTQKRKDSDMQIIITRPDNAIHVFSLCVWFCYDSTHWSYQAQRFFRLFNDDWSCGVNQSTIVLPSAIMAASLGISTVFYNRRPLVVMCYHVVLDCWCVFGVCDSYLCFLWEI